MKNLYYIAIEGPIGVGKTSLANLMSKELGARLVLEEFEEKLGGQILFENDNKDLYFHGITKNTEQIKRDFKKMFEEIYFTKPFVVDSFFDIGFAYLPGKNCTLKKLVK